LGLLLSADETPALGAENLPIDGGGAPPPPEEEGPPDPDPGPDPGMLPYDIVLGIEREGGAIMAANGS
jgi:hypothetical protein